MKNQSWNINKLPMHFTLLARSCSVIFLYYEVFIASVPSKPQYTKKPINLTIPSCTIINHELFQFWDFLRIILKNKNFQNLGNFWDWRFEDPNSNILRSEASIIFSFFSPDTWWSEDSIFMKYEDSI